MISAYTLIWFVLLVLLILSLFKEYKIILFLAQNLILIRNLLPLFDIEQKSDLIS